ncbi:uncharacterized protein LOC122643423 [Telopea speciosissima]|uniref:uncharacterized protein LOC122643423 n=1 Tax=Telopea speciosissima TaxID=54955 RepID=UPI001CC4E2B6|nr:uncharacterized protein LOC122643423 [Telopea speciosissima]
MPNDPPAIDSSSNPPLVVSSPYYLHPSAQPGAALITPTLNGDNYPTWHRSMLMALEAKNKIVFVNGTLTKPTSTSPNLPYWIRCNSMLQSWLVHSTIPSISPSLLWIETARDIWLDLHDRFSQHNAPHIFEIRRAISTHVQGIDSLSAYYNTLNGYHDELSFLSHLAVMYMLCCGNLC